MARAPGIVQINQYQQRTRPSGPAQPKARAQELPDPFGGMLDGLAEGGAALAHVMAEREEDDARTYSARAIAEATNRYAERSAEIEANALDGWRDLTRDSNTAWETIDQEYIEGAPTRRAREYVGQHLALLRADMIGRLAERERDLRRQWRLDDSEATVSTWEPALLRDPTQWARAHASITQTVGSYTDISANDRRDLTTRYQQSLAGFAVTGLIQRDPEGALRQLRGASAASGNPEAIASLIGGQITSTQRDPQHNAEVGGAPNSMHLTGEAVDLTVPERYRGMSREAIEADVRQHLSAAGVEASEIIYEGDHIHVGWRGVANNSQRPALQNADGSISTEETITIESDGRYYNIPTIVNGQRVGEERAIALWEAGQNQEVGVFDTQQQAEQMAAARSRQIGIDRNSPFAFLSGEQVLRAEAAARAEIERRQSTTNATIRERETVATALWEAGDDAPNAPTVEEVRVARGDVAAAQYQLRYETFRARSQMNGRSNEDLSALATRPALRSGTEAERLSHAAETAAAQAVLGVRQSDPMRYAASQGLVPNEAQMADAITSGDIAEVGALLRRRVGIAQEQRARLGADTPASPFTNLEAAQLRGMLDRLTPETRLDALAMLQQGASLPRRGDGGAYSALVRQLYADDPGAMAGAGVFIRRASIETGSGAVSSRTAARRLMAGAALLNPPGVDTNANGQPERRRSTFDMPDPSVMERAFQSYVRDAYAEDPQGYREAFQAFRAYYAGAASEQGINAAGLSFVSDGAGGGAVEGDSRAVALAGEAAQVAVGNLRQNAYGGRPGLPSVTYLPWGMNEDQFTNSLRMGWDGIRARYDRAELSDDPRDYDYARDEGGFYTLFYRGMPVPDNEGDFVRVRPRLYDR